MKNKLRLILCALLSASCVLAFTGCEYKVKVEDISTEETVEDEDKETEEKEDEDKEAEDEKEDKDKETEEESEDKDKETEEEPEDKDKEDEDKKSDDKKGSKDSKVTDYLFDDPYISCEQTEFLKTYKEGTDNYIGMQSSGDERKKTQLDNGQYYQELEVTYEVGDDMNYLVGIMCPIIRTGGEEDQEGICKIYDQDNELLYESPIMRCNTEEQLFSVDLKGATEITIKFETDSKYAGFIDNYRVLIKNCYLSAEA